MPAREPPPRPFLKWVGGKRQLLPELLQAIDAAGPFKHYHEPFVGGGALFFTLARTGKLPARSYLSDANQNLIRTYQGVRDEVDAIVGLLKEHRRHHGEEYFYTIRAQSPRLPARQAARIIYLNKTCFNGLYRENRKGQFNVPYGRYRNPAILDEENLRAVSDTLQNVDIAVRDFSSILETAGKGDLVYFDPPYNPVSKTAHFTAYSRGGFSAEAQAQLANVAEKLSRRGVKVILSNSMTEATRSLYTDFYLYEVLASRSVNSRVDKRGKVPEALITNFPIPLAKSAVRHPANNRAMFGEATAGELEKVDVKKWLLENKYEDVAALIDEVRAEWERQGKRTRRNWWEILAGDSKGSSRIVAGREFPVLRAAQVRQGVPVTKNALRRSRKEETPPVRVTGRWAN